MKRSYFSLFTIFFLLFSAFFWGCGDSGPGSPGSQGTEDTGVILDATIVPSYLDTDTSSVDAFQDACEGGTSEDFTDHSATVTINATLLNPNTTFQPGILYVEKYTITYLRSTDSIGSPPIESDTRFVTIVINPPAGAGFTTATDTVEFLDLIRKDQYRSDMSSGRFTSGLSFINNYTAVYTFEGKNQFGDPFSFKVQKDFQIGNFDYCG